MRIPLEDLIYVTLVSEDAFLRLDWCGERGYLLGYEGDESCLLMKVVYWWKLSIDESCLLMKVVYWWKLSIDESFLLMKVV